MKALAIIIALLSSAQAFAWSGTVLVCRMTGAVLEKCCCPKAEASQAGTSVSRPCCCDHVDRSFEAAGPALLQGRERDAGLQEWAASPPNGPEEVALTLDVTIGPPQWAGPKDGARSLWLKLRHLLI